MLKYFFSSMLLFFTMVTVAQSPTFQANPIVENNVQQVLEKQFYNFDLYQFPVENIHRHVSRSDRSDFKLKDGQEINWDIELQAYDIRSDQYVLRVATADGIKKMAKGKNITYRGQLANQEESDVRLTIADGFFYGLVETNSTTYYIEPLSYFIQNAPADQFVVYQEVDVIPRTGKTCGVTEAQQRKAEIEAAGNHKNNTNTLSSVMNCFEVEMAIASDFSMFTKYGNSIPNVQNHNIAVMNNVQTNYDDEFNNELRFVIVENFVSNCSSCDPLSNTTDAGDLLTEFRAWGNSGGFSVTYDVAQFWTNRNFDGSTIGIAWVGAICTNSRYHCLQDFSNNAQSLRVLTSHELGHNFDSFHDNNTTCIMSPSVNNSTCWSNQSTNAINAYSGAIVGGCLSACQVNVPPPVVSFTANPSNGCEPLVVEFIDDSSNSPDSWNWTFPGGNPATSSDQNPIVTYNVAGTYSVTLQVTNAGGSDSETITNFINVEPLPIADFETSIDLGLVDFINTSQNGLTYLWDFGDGNTSTEFEPNNVYFESGFYDVTFTVFNSCGSETTTRTIQIILPPSADFSGDVISGCAPLVVEFTDNSTNIPEQWFWTFEEGSPATSDFQNPIVSFPIPGTFTVTLDVFNASGSDSYQIIDYITVLGIPEPDFTFGIDDLEVNFVNSSTSANSYSWDFGDGNTSTEVNPTHTYAQGGNYDVMLIAFNDCGTNVITQTISLLVPPQAGFSANVVSGCAPLTVNFIDESIGATSWDWTFEGGNPATSSDQNPVVVFENPGDFTVSLTATNSAGNSFVNTEDFITVFDVPIGSFTTSSDGNTVTFTNTSMNATSYSWDFGDGGTSTQTNPIHTYADDGQYTVILTATNDCGSETSEQTITTSSAPQAAFTSSGTSGCAPFTVSFTDGSTSNTTSWAWSFPGGSPSNSTDQNPTVVYADAGTYSVTLVASNGTGMSTITETDYVVVAPLAAPSFTTSSDENTVTFTNTSMNATSYSWDFGDGGTSTQTNPTHTYADDGQYTVILTATNDCGSETSQQTITTSSAPQAAFTSSGTSGCAPFTVSFTDGSTSNTTSWAWSFPGGSPSSSTEQNPTVTYANAGTYSVTLVASNGTGMSTVTETDYVVVAPLAAPSFTTSSDENTVTFTNTSMNATSYSWDFGDGGTSTQMNPTHTYVDDGQYTVILTATNDCGSETSEQTITTSSAPQAAFTSSGTSGCAPFTVSFTDGSTSNTTSWAWSFPGGSPSSSTEQNPTVVYADAGTYSVTLVASNGTGMSTVTETDYVVVAPLAAPSFTTSSDENTVTFTNTSMNATSYSWDFGDGGTSTQTNPTHTYADDGQYTVILTATNDCGSETSQQTITTSSAPQAAFTSSGTSGCAPFTVSFTDGSTSNTTSWAWSFPGGSPSSSIDQNPTVTYADAGTYSVTLVASNGTGMSTVTETDYVVVAPLAAPSFTTSSDENTVTFTNTSMNATSYSWDFGDGGTSTQMSPTHTYADDGQYTVILTATNDCGSETSEQLVTTSSAPQAAFTSSGTSGCAPFTVSFTDGSTSNTTSWDWSFPGGSPSSSTEQNPTVTYADAGTYSVTLVASNGTGMSTVTETDYVVVAPLAAPSFTTSSDENTVTFTNTSMNATSYSWDFGDGGTSTQTNPTHTYADDGQYTVILTATNNCGSETSQQTITTSSAPQAAFTSSGTSGCAPFTVSFTDGSTSNTTSWAWSFPGGSPSSSTDQNPTVVYADAGTYSVTLVASNGTGMSTITETDYVVVAPLAAPSFTTSSDENTVTFTNTSMNATSYSWDFGDGGTSTQTNPTHTYPDDGQYTVTLTATNDCGSETSEQLVTTSSAPQAAFTSSGTSGCAPFTVSFTDGSTSNTTSWAWSFPGGSPSSSTEQNPTVTYADAGTYSVTLVASNGTGMSTVTETDYVVVAPLAAPSFTTSSDENTVTFTNTSMNATSYSWDFGDGGTSTQMSPTHTYADDGQYTVILTATNDCGSITTEQLVTTSSIPQAGFTASNTNGCGPLTVNFMDQSTSNTTSWAWSFPGGTPSSSTEQNPTVIYENAGTYTVNLVASNSSGATNVTEVDLVTIAPLPSPGFETTIDGSQVIFNNTTTNGNSYSWDFGDGTTSTETNPIHLYSTDGQYDVILTATNECGMVSTEIVTISIVALPAAGFTAVTRSGCAPLTVSFQDESSESTSAWDWSFEGGTPATSDEENPTVVYDTPGTYTVVLTVSNSSGMNTLTQIDYIEVFPETVAGFDLTTMNNEISIVNNSMNATGYVWSFGDGTTSTDANPTHEYTSSGTYTVSLTAVGLCGTVTTTQTVMITVTNILEEEKVSLFEVYPNPGSGMVILNVEGEPTNDLEIRLIDLLGRVLYSESQNFSGSLTREYDWTNLAAATYIIQLRSGDSVGYRKILIEK